MSPTVHSPLHASCAAALLCPICHAIGPRTHLLPEHGDGAEAGRRQRLVIGFARGDGGPVSRVHRGRQRGEVEIGVGGLAIGAGASFVIAAVVILRV